MSSVNTGVSMKVSFIVENYAIGAYPSMAMYGLTTFGTEGSGGIREGSANIMRGIRDWGGRCNQSSVYPISSTTLRSAPNKAGSPKAR